MNPNQFQSHSGVSVSASVSERGKVLDNAGFFHTQFVKWPQEIPRSQRVKVNTGHRSFCLHREYVGAEALNRRAIQLKGNLVITVFSGSVVIERGTERQLVEAGGMAMVREGPVELTEIPVAGQSYGEVYYFFFPSEVLRDWSRRNHGAERIALGLIPWPSEIAVMPQGLTNLLPVLHLGGAAFPSNFAKVLTVAANQMSAAMFDFLAKTYYLPRLHLNLFLEQHILCDQLSIGEAYPGGTKQLTHDFRVFQGVPVAAWLRKRRMQLSRLWMIHNKAEANDLAEKFHYGGQGDFEKDFRRENRIQAAAIKAGRPWQDLDLAKRLALGVPFWLPVDKSPAAVDEGGECKVDAEADFWSATSTIGSVCNVIRVSFKPHSHASMLGEILLQHAA